MASRTHLNLLLYIQSYGDIYEGITQISIGSTGNTILFNSESKNTGKAHAVPGFLDGVLDMLGAHLDDMTAIWGRFNTKSTGVAPQVAWSSVNGMAVVAITSATKDEGAETLTINFETDNLWQSQFAFVPHALIEGVPSMLELVSTTDSSCTLRFVDDTGTAIDINDLGVRFSCVGRIKGVTKADFPDPPIGEQHAPGGGGGK